MARVPVTVAAVVFALSGCSQATVPDPPVVRAEVSTPASDVPTDAAHGDHGGEPAEAAASADHAAHGATEQAAAATPAKPRRSRAARLVNATRRSLPRWSDVGEAEADGFRSLEDDEDRYVHYMNVDWMVDGRVLDARRPESLVYEATDEGLKLVSAMYVLPVGTRMDDVPDLGDERVRWHVHDNLCFSTDGTLAGHVVDGKCTPGGINITTPPMLHVWIVDHDCGPFADLGNGGCKHQH